LKKRINKNDAAQELLPEDHQGFSTKEIDAPEAHIFCPKFK
jgi:hypothetical protein